MAKGLDDLIRHLVDEVALCGVEGETVFQWFFLNSFGTSNFASNIARDQCLNPFTKVFLHQVL